MTSYAITRDSVKVERMSRSFPGGVPTTSYSTVHSFIRAAFIQGDEALIDVKTGRDQRIEGFFAFHHGADVQVGDVITLDADNTQWLVKSIQRFPRHSIQIIAERQNVVL